MARIAGVNLPPDKRIEAALPIIYGIGLSRSQEILKQTGINPDIRVKDLSNEQEGKLRNLIEKDFKVEGDLKREVMMNVKRMVEIGCYRGIRHAKHLPVKGQRTRTNSRTVRGNVRKTMGSGRKALTKT